MASESDDPSLDINIRTTADGEGVQETARGLDKLGDSASDAGKKVGEISSHGGQGLHEVAKSGREAAQVISGIEHASEGGVKGLIGLGHAAHGLGGIFRTVFAANPFGVVVLGITAAIGAFSLFRKAAADTAEELKKNHEESEKLAVKLNEIQTIAPTGIEKISKAVKQLTKDYADLYAQTDKFRALQKTNDAAADALDLAKIDKSEQEALKKDPKKAEEIAFKAEQQRAALRERAKQHEIDAERDENELRSRNADQQLADFGPKVSAAQREKIRAGNAFTAANNEARQRIASVKDSSGDEEEDEAAKQAAEQAVAHAVALKLTYDKAVEVLKDIQAEADAASANARSIKSTAKDENEKADTETKTGKIESDARKLKDGNTLLKKLQDTGSIQEKIGSTDAEISALRDQSNKSYGDFKIGGNATQKKIAELEKTREGLQDFFNAAEAKNAEISALAAKASKDEKKTREQLKNNRQGS
jgi:hypothetical protein